MGHRLRRYGGPATLAATALPWTGSSFAALTTGLPSSAIALGITGWGTLATPLAQLFPQGVPGCDLLVSPDFSQVVFPVAGIAPTRVVLPAAAVLVGQVLHHQVIVIELDAALAIHAITSSNGLALTIGAF